MSRHVAILRFIGFMLGGAIAAHLICTVVWLCMYGQFGHGEGARLNILFAGANRVGTVWGAVAGAVLACRPMRRRRRILFVAAMVLWLPFVALLGDMLVYQPIKFGYLFYRFNAAKTPEEERAAFALAKDWGWWEVHLESPPKTWFDGRDLDGVVSDPARTLAVEVEFWECMPNGVPYRAYRTLIEKSNIYVLTRE